ncbi:unnamed protein product [Symbiodinium natans]|uniref:Uncharacterized protein n=1 Tax=Symbiodinium natans TaxID=878477 RepID=A0A812MXU1_9DINO|nr:unnamed protein product [Symbiodinium natans]
MVTPRSMQGGASDVEEYDRSRAFRTFRDHFGNVHARWTPGMTVTGTYVAAGKKVTITIYPDGATEEHEEDAAGPGGYSTALRLH